jgi:hypothetical protein
LRFSHSRLTQLLEVIAIDLRDLERAVRDADAMTDETHSLLFDRAPAAPPRPQTQKLRLKSTV